MVNIMKKNISLCYVLNSIKNCGPVNILYSMIKGLDLNKYNVTIITLIDDNDIEYMKKFTCENLKVINFDYPKSKGTLLKGKEISRRINDFKFDIIHVHGNITAFLVKFVKAKKVITVHNKLYEDFKTTYGYFIGWIINKIYIRLMKKYNYVIGCSKSSGKICQKYIPSAVYVRNGLYLEEKNMKNIRSKIRKELSIPESSTVYLYAGTYTVRKNVLRMLEMFSKNLHENEYLICLGNGKLYEQAQCFSSNNIIQLGFKENAVDYMYACDVYTSFSKSEGLPTSVIEAMHSGMLLLLSNIDSHKEFFDYNGDYYIGETFEIDDEKSFKICKDKVSTSLKNDSYDIQKKYFSSDIMMNKYCEYYNNCMNEVLR